jgi:lipopolysaccharide transport system permease protein
VALDPSVQLRVGLFREVTRTPLMREPIIIEPNQPDLHYWLDLWQYRELFRILAWRDLSVRYKQTVVGALWALIRPLLTMAVFTVIFGHIARLPSDGSVPYALMVFAGMLPWTFFSTGLADAANSLIVDSNLISKVYFPRLIVPTATIVVAFADFLISFCILIALMVWYQFLPNWQILVLPIFILAAFFATMGPALWISALNVRYRDFRYIIPFIVQFGLYVSPVGFSSSVIPERWRMFYALNPMAGVIDGFRWCILGGQSQLYVPGLVVSASVMAFFLWFGFRQFRKMENSFADLI